ncbi:hypothetical protein B0H17DRAFT_1149277 [Mycena rosella]|uniref:Uncharacterized protein n=1 Tax=Mycena rosella TaxID=1033263 RepID=A0AAD7FQW2_MYCRO|nr:hypothetical protein B0H17DRAFT_1149277 [Mycena rosella]
MDPLKYWDMRAIDDWNAFKPDMKGYIPPQELGLWPDCDSIEVSANSLPTPKRQLINFTHLDYMRDNDAPFLALSVVERFPATRLTVRGETFAAPISPRDMKFLFTHLGNDRASEHTVAAAEAKILGDASRSSISQGHSAVLRTLRVRAGDGDRETTLEALSVFKAGIHQLLTASRDSNHFATIFVILPIFVDSADIRVYATHENITSDVRLPKDLSQSVSAIGVYAGISDAHIEVGTGAEVVCLIYHECVVPEAEPWFVPRLEYLSGALPPLRDAFCLWRHNLNSGAKAPALMLLVLDHNPKCSTDFSGDDVTLLCHLAPLAQAYGFKMFIGRLVHTMSTKQEVYHDPKEYFESTEDIDRSKLRMSNEPRVRYGWNELRTLGGAIATQPVLLAMATRMMKSGYLHDQFMDRDLDENEDDVEIEDESICFATVIYKHSELHISHTAIDAAEIFPVRTASILFIAP